MITFANCESFKSKYIDDAASRSGISCAINECSNEIHTFDDCQTTNLSITCDKTFNVSGLNTFAEIDYSDYQTDDVIRLSGALYGTVTGGDFNNSVIDCAFTFYYTYGATLSLSCANTAIDCTIDGNPAGCEQVLDIGASGNTINGCSTN